MTHNSAIYDFIQSLPISAARRARVFRGMHRSAYSLDDLKRGLECGSIEFLTGVGPPTSEAACAAWRERSAADAAALQQWNAGQPHRVAEMEEETR